jgi:hypothetical protein
MAVWLSAFVLALSVLLGGGTHAGFLGDVIVQLVSIPLLAVSLWSFANVKELSEHQPRAIAFFSCAVIALFVIQLCPLPFEVPSIGGTKMSREVAPVVRTVFPLR